MKILYVSTVGATMGFFVDQFKKLISDGHTVEIACNRDAWDYSEKVSEIGLKYYPIPFSRSPFSKDNFIAYNQLKEIIIDGNYDIVHCHTPNAAAITRLVGRNLRKNGLRVFYTAHGFHFYKGAPLKNWLIYYPIEWLCARWTDTLITINTEDYALAKKHMRAKNVCYVPGVGIDLGKFGSSNVSPCVMRESLGIPANKVWILNVGELSERKNQIILIKAIKDIPDVYLTIAGQGSKKEEYEYLIQKNGLRDRVKLLGYRNDISELCEAADIFAFPSFHEGLSVALMEAMACAMPVVCSSIRGNLDLIDTNGGELFDPHSVEDTERAIRRILHRDFKTIGEYNATKVNKFDISNILNSMDGIYMSEIIGGGYKNVDVLIRRSNHRKELGCEAKDLLLLSVGELNDNKNHETVINAIASMEAKEKRYIRYAIAGQGDRKDYLISLIKKNNLEAQVKLLGYRNDVNDLLNACDVFVFPSFREGLSVSLMEAMAMGKPCVVSRIRGNVDLIDENGGELFDPHSTEECKHAIGNVWLKSKDIMQHYNKKKIRNFSTAEVIEQMTGIYKMY